jgi:small conductance mechanosensitive channel
VLHLALARAVQVPSEPAVEALRPAADWVEAVTRWGKATGALVLVAVVTLLVGLWVAKLLVRALSGMLARGKVDATLARFLANLAYYALATVVVIAALGSLGVQTGSFVAIVGAAGLAIGFALQGSLGNLASGVMIMLFRPFKVGDLVAAGGQEGVVEEIQVFATVLNTLDNKRVILPNSAVMGGSITNYTGNALRRVDLAFATGLGEDVARVKSILAQACAGVPEVLKEPAVEIEYLEVVPGGLRFVCRPWCKTEHYWRVHFAVMAAVKQAFERERVSVPLPRNETVVIQAG